MNINLELSSPLKEKLELESPVVEVKNLCTVQDFVRHIAKEASVDFRMQVLDVANNLQPDILLTVNDEQMDWDTPRVLEEGDTVQIVSPVPDVEV